MGGEHFVVPCKLTRNGISIALSALIDTGANGFAFISTKRASELARQFNFKFKKLPSVVPVRGYNGKSSDPISQYITVSLIIDGRKILNLPFLILDLGQHDVILGRTFLAALDVKPDCRRGRLLWPDCIPPTNPLLLNDLNISSEVIEKRPIDLAAQRDANRRDRQMAQVDKRRMDGINSLVLTSAQPLSPESDRMSPSASSPVRYDRANAPDPGSPRQDEITSCTNRSYSPCLPRQDDMVSCTDRFIAKSYSPCLRGKSSFQSDTERDLRTMEVELHTVEDATPKNGVGRGARTDVHNSAIGAAKGDIKNNVKVIASQHHTDDRRQNWCPPVDIALISGNAFHLNCKRPSNELFATSLYEIDRLIEDRRDSVDEAHDQDEALHIAALQTTDPDNESLSHLQQVPPSHHDWLHVFSKKASDTLPPRRTYDHKIQLVQGKSESDLTYSPLYKMSLEELEITKKYLEENLDKGFIEPSQAPFAAPVLFVKKPAGGLRFCIDFRKLNLLTRKDQYPLPLIDETLARLATAKIFTKLDIRQAFHRIRVHADSEELTTFRTRYGAYKCKVLPFGLTNGPATYQRYMNDILFDYLDDFCTAYLDDILIYSDNLLEHDMHVNKVLARLDAAGLQADIKKCEFNVMSTKYLGFIISTDGIRVDPEKVRVIEEWKPPGTVKGIQSFLGFCNFYRRFIRDYGKIARPLIELTKKDFPFRFSSTCMTAFTHLKHLLISAPVLQHYDPKLQCMLETDASDGVVGAVLSQKHGDEWKPVAFFSKSFLPAELNYTIHDKEMMAIVKSLKEWRAELSGTPFDIPVITDHKALEYFMTTKQLNARQARWAEFLSDFRILITYRAGKQNIPADILTRRSDDLDVMNQEKRAYRIQALLRQDQVDPLIWKQATTRQEPPTVIKAIELLPLESQISIVDKVLTANRTAETLQTLRDLARQDSDAAKGYAIDNGLLLFEDRLVVPDDGPLRALLIRECHDGVTTAHPGRDKTYQLLRPLYYWPRMYETVAQYCRNCHECRRSSIPRDKKPGLLHPLPVPDRPWQHITTDFCTFPTDQYGYDNVLVFIDRLSKQAISIPCKKTVTATDLASLYIYHIYRYYGPPQTIVSDRGSQFMSEFWKELNRILGSKLTPSTAYHPQTDGQTEIYNQYLEQRLRPFVNYYQNNWSELLPIMDYAQLTLPHDSLGGLSPFEVLRGFAPEVSWNWRNENGAAPPKETLAAEEAHRMARSMHEAFEKAKTSIRNAQAKMQRSTNTHRREVHFEPGNMVWLDMRQWRTDRPSRKLDFPTNGPFKILAKEGHSYRLDLPESMKVHPVFSADKLRIDPNDALEGQNSSPPTPINVTGDEEFEVQEILAVRKKRNKLEYRVSWIGYDADLEWYPPSDLKYSPHKIREFHQANPTLPGPPARLLDWLKAWEAGTDEYDELDDDKEMPRSLRTSFFGRGG